jgi:hypothetical protein
MSQLIDNVQSKRDAIHIEEVESIRLCVGPNPQPKAKLFLLSQQHETHNQYQQSQDMYNDWYENYGTIEHRTT